jgi:hypothetical protein
MPTGYTSSIYDNKNDSFKSFVLSCARAFGPCMHQRDDDMRDKPKLRELDIKYHLDALEQAKNYKKPTKAEFEAYKKEKIEEAYASLKKDKELRERYTVMLEKAKNWTPPTPDHAGLKKFMIEQLESSLKWDCHVVHRKNELIQWKAMEYSDYVEELNNDNKRSIEYHTEEIEKEKKNVEYSNRWITALYENLETV